MEFKWIKVRLLIDFWCFRLIWGHPDLDFGEAYIETGPGSPLYPEKADEQKGSSTISGCHCDPLPLRTPFVELHTCGAT